MEAQHMTQQTFANFIGMSAASLSSIFNDRTRPTLNTVEAIKSKIPNLSTDWLMFGRGAMFVDGQGDASASAPADAKTQQEPALDLFDAPTAPSAAAADYRQQHQAPSPTGFQMQQDMKYFDKSRRKITEIRVFFDDQTYESFVPKK